MNIIVIGIQTEISTGSFSVVPKTAEKSLKKKIITVAIIARKTYVQLLSLKLVPNEKKALKSSILNKKNGKAKC